MVSAPSTKLIQELQAILANPADAPLDPEPARTLLETIAHIQKMERIQAQWARHFDGFAHRNPRGCGRCLTPDQKADRANLEAQAARILELERVNEDLRDELQAFRASAT